MLLNLSNVSEFWTIIFAAVIAIPAAVLLRFFRQWWSLKHIPGPPLASITNLQRVWWVTTGRAHLYHQAAHEKYGDIVRLGPNMVSISNPEAISTIYPIRPGFPKGDFYATLRPYNRQRGSLLAVFNTQDEAMHKLIKSPIAPLFSLSNVVAFEGLVEDTISLLSDQLDKRFSGKDLSFEFGEWLQYFAFECMGSMSFSKKYGFLDQGHDVGGMLDAIFKFQRAAAPMTQVTWLDPLLYKNQLLHRFRRTPGMSILSTVGKVIQERRERTAEDGKSHKDFLARFLEIQEANPDLPPWASTAWTFSNIMAGSDSVGTIMQTLMCRQSNNALLLEDLHFPDNLLLHPETLRTLKDELIAGDLSAPFPKWNEVHELSYLDACVQEAARLQPPFALPFERVVPAGGISVLGTYIPEGTLVGCNPYVTNRYEATFGCHPESWRPERWLVGDESHRKKLEQSLLTADGNKFGAGRRICLGKHLGIFEIKKLVSFIVLNYDTQLIDPKALTVENAWQIKRRGFYCKIRRQQR